MTQHSLGEETVRMTAVARRPLLPRLRVHPTDHSHRVTSLELFFDLVFVYAITQVTALMAKDPTWGGALRGFVILAMLWFSWASYSWVTNSAKADEGYVRLALVLAMFAIFTVALAIPEAFKDQPGGLDAPLVFAFALVMVHVVHLMTVRVMGGRDPAMRRQLIALATPVAMGKALLVAGAFAEGDLRLALWAGALLVEYTGVFFGAGRTTPNLNAPAHFAERHGLIIIIAIGESIVAIGVGVGQLPLSAPVLVAVVLGLIISQVLWWTYFDVVAIVAERVLHRTTGEARARLARDSYTYLHFPMVLGIVYLALGLKKVVSYVADTEHHALSDALSTVPLVAMYGGAAIYLYAHIAFRYRNVHSLNKQRTVVATMLLLVLPLMTRVPALAALAVLATMLVSLIVYEANKFADARHAVRHGTAADIVHRPKPAQETAPEHPAVEAER